MRSGKEYFIVPDLLNTLQLIYKTAKNLTEHKIKVIDLKNNLSQMNVKTNWNIRNYCDNFALNDLFANSHLCRYDYYDVSNSEYREFSPNANFITANFITAVFQSYY